VANRMRVLLLGLVAIGAARAICAQQFGVGATYGWYNDIEKTFQLGNFRSPAWEGWLETRLDQNISLRLAYGNMHVPGDNVGQVVGPPESPLVMPDYRDRIQYVSLSVTYLFWEGPFTSGIFGGIGGYSIRPDSISPEFDPFRDARERVFGFNAGVDGSLRVARQISIVGRLTYHGILSQTKRSLLVASAGAEFRF